MKHVIGPAIVALFTAFVLVCDYLQYLWHGGLTQAQYLLAVFLVIFAVWSVATSFITHSQTQKGGYANPAISRRIISENEVFPLYGWAFQVLLSMVFISLFTTDYGLKIGTYVPQGIFLWGFLELVLVAVVVVLQRANFVANERTIALQSRHEISVAQSEMLTSGIQLLIDKCAVCPELETGVEKLRVQIASMPLKTSTQGSYYLQQADLQIRELSTRSGMEITSDDLNRLAETLRKAR